MSLDFGILGGGQLGRMLAEAANKNSYSSICLSGKDEPAGNAGLSISSSLDELYRNSKHLLIESEFFEFSKLGEAKEKLKPGFDCISLLSNKLEQKRLLAKLNLASPEFIDFKASDWSQDFWNKLCEKFPNGFVLKAAFGGYDGKGNFICENKLEGFQSSEDFLKNSKSKSFYAEELVNFKHELALVSVASKSDGLKAYPLVITEQFKSACQKVSGPAEALGLPHHLQSEAEKIAKTLVQATGLEGVFAIEFFWTGDKLLINEIAPRVHNSGHCTQLSHSPSQFEAHLFAIEGKDFSISQKSEYFGMWNLLGLQNVANFKPEIPETPEGLMIYWYDKKDQRVGRKMGHINVVASSLDELNQSLGLASKIGRSMLETNHV